MKPWEANFRSVTPYVPGEQPRPDGGRLIKLNTNENPYPPCPGVRRRLQDLDTDLLRRYPDPSASELTEAIAGYHGVSADRVFVGVGSDDVLGMAFLTFFNSPKPILFPDVTYSFYPVWAELFGIPCERVPLDEAWAIRPGDYMRENGGIVFPNPNAPTGLLMEKESVESIIRSCRESVVIVDEAYIDFAGDGASVCGLCDRYENLLVVRTLSKSYSLAGARIGYAIGSPSLIRALKNVKESYNSYTMNAVSISVGAEAVRDVRYLKETVQAVVRTRERAKERLREMGFTFPDSEANFLFAHHTEVPAAEIYQALRREHIYVRHFDGPRVSDYLRISVGTDEEMEMLYASLETFFSERQKIWTAGGCGRSF